MIFLYFFGLSLFEYCIISRTFWCIARTGLLRVSVKCRFLGNLGFEDGVWIAKHLSGKKLSLINILLKSVFFEPQLNLYQRSLGVYLIKHAMNITKAIPISSTAYQNSVTHCAMVSSVSWLSNKFLSRTSGPSASTLRHFKNTSQYPEIVKYLYLMPK